MLQAIILTLMAFECLLYVWIGRTMAGLGMATGVIVAYILTIALLWRLAYALPSFMVAAVLRLRDRRRLPLGNSLTALAGEIKARAISYCWSQAAPGWALGNDPLGSTGGTPILLVHGFFSNRGMWVRFRQRLAAANVGSVYTVTLEPLLGSIDAMVICLEQRIAEILRTAGHEKLIVVAHSMGGLVTRAFMAKSGTGCIDRFITLGSPHHGTQIASLGWVECARQMRYEGPWLETLAGMETARPPTVPALSIYTLNDDLVYPPESGVLEWAENVPVSAVGHVGLLFSEAVANRVIAAITKPI